jgi:hypothetical protein
MFAPTNLEAGDETDRAVSSRLFPGRTDGRFQFPRRRVVNFICGACLLIAFGGIRSVTRVGERGDVSVARGRYDPTGT